MRQLKTTPPWDSKSAWLRKEWRNRIGTISAKRLLVIIIYVIQINDSGRWTAGLYRASGSSFETLSISTTDILAHVRGTIMTYAIDRVALGVATAGILSVLALGTPRANALPLVFVQATPPPGMSSPVQQHASGGNAAAPNGPSLGERAEARIADLHRQLQITAAEEAQFAAVANVMRANARSMDTLLEERSRDTDETAVASLRWYERLTDAHAAALKTFVPAFEALYATLSDSQRHAADVVFRRFAQRPAPQKSR